MEVDVFGDNKDGQARNAIVTKEVTYFNRLYYSMYVKDNTTMDPAIHKEHLEMLVGNSGIPGLTLASPPPQKKRSISEVNNTPSSSKQSVNNTSSKKKKTTDKISKIKVYTSSLFDKGLLASGDTVMFKHDDKEIKCKVNNHGELEVNNADKTDTRISNNLRIITQFICKAYNLPLMGKSKYWNLFYLVNKNGSRNKLKTLREQYLALHEQGNSKVVAEKSDKSEEKETAKRRRRKQAEEASKKNARLLISQLVSSGLLKDGAKVIYRGQKTTFHGKITKSKFISYYDQLTKREEQFETPNSFKSHIGELGNCWQQMVLVDDDQEISFQTLRDKYFE
ncbi:predicted protein [Naegleria gruberi]|uniref:Predicted protein n=1 Tax=Naegleria gruberi TaxID=5762 RepID=D2UYV9_NAEGR|nr:uncharacterized protein NAEGRDRAFT_45333 [Naegleria gruberi]EFC49844.1 predicted protein [Naegleria gruberi]|eukprot:XP_002682588.1 predicted protein [Naegleria gruberi strain NEG-M]